ncbi:hypothetical protein, partial [Rhodococcus pyridinivorans]
TTFALAAAAAAGVGAVDLSAQGRAAGASFAAGLRSQTGAVASAARALGAAAKANKGHYRGLRGMAADRIMLVENGEAMVAGFINGMNSQRAELVTTARQLATDVRGEFSANVVPRIGVEGAMKMNQQVYVQVDAGTAADPVTVGREIRDYLDAYSFAVNRAEAVRA